jgi:hypothetical protein
VSLAQEDYFPERPSEASLRGLRMCAHDYVVFERKLRVAAEACPLLSESPRHKYPDVMQPVNQRASYTHHHLSPSPTCHRLNGIQEILDEPLAIFDDLHPYSMLSPVHRPSDFDLHPSKGIYDLVVEGPGPIHCEVWLRIHEPEGESEVLRKCCQRRCDINLQRF